MKLDLIWANHLQNPTSDLGDYSTYNIATKLVGSFHYHSLLHGFDPNEWYMKSVFLIGCLKPRLLGPESSVLTSNTQPARGFNANNFQRSNEFKKRDLKKWFFCCLLLLLNLFLLNVMIIIVDQALTFYLLHYRIQG